MLTDLWHLFWRTVVAAPSLVSSNWGAVVFTFLVFITDQSVRLLRDGMPSGRVAWSKNICWGAAVVVVAWVGLTFVSMARIVRGDHVLLRRAVAENASLRATLERKRHNLDRTDPAFLNMIYTIRAFMAYRDAIGHDAKCQILITEPPGNLTPAFVIASFAVTGSKCANGNLQSIGIKPENELNESRKGEVNGVIVLHALPGTNGADRLVDELGNLLQVRRDYAMPSSPLKLPENTIWLQFGPGTAWNL
jgi:hypothetical protein